MYLKEKYPILTKQACEKIIDETIQEIDTGIPSDFSFQAIIREGRKPALAARMTSKVLVFQRARLGQDGLISIEGTQRYSGQNIADIFVNSVRTSSYTFYPITGTLPTQGGLEQLILFVKGKEKYEPYARFNITDIKYITAITNSMASTLVDVTPIFNMHYTSVLKIENVVTNNLPQNYLGNASAEGIYQKAFKGAAPVIVCI